MNSSSRKPLKRCANGCDRPPDPPSLVICRECQDHITATLEVLLARMTPAPETE